MSLKTGRRTNVGGKVGQRPHTSAGARVNNYNPSTSRHRRVPRGIRRAPVGRIPKGYTPVDKLSMSLPLKVRENVLPTILPVGRERAAPIQSHDVPIREDWSKLFRQSKIVAKTQAQLKRKQYQARLPKNMVGALDVDGDGLVDEVEINLAKILKHVPGQDLNNDGIVDENETRICRIARGKEIYAENFVRDFPGIRNFWKPYRHFNDDQIVNAIRDNQEFAVNMRNMLLKGRQYKCAASTRMHQALTDTRSTHGVDHLLFDQRTQARRQQSHKAALFKQALSKHEAKIFPTGTFGFRKKFDGESGQERKSFRTYAELVRRARGIMGCHRMKL